MWVEFRVEEWLPTSGGINSTTSLSLHCSVFGYFLPNHLVKVEECTTEACNLHICQRTDPKAGCSHLSFVVATTRRVSCGTSSFTARSSS